MSVWLKMGTSGLAVEKSLYHNGGKLLPISVYGKPKLDVK